MMRKLPPTDILCVNPGAGLYEQFDKVVVPLPGRQVKGLVLLRALAGLQLLLGEKRGLDGSNMEVRMRTAVMPMVSSTWVCVRRSSLETDRLPTSTAEKRGMLPSCTQRKLD